MKRKKMLFVSLGIVLLAVIAVVLYFVALRRANPPLSPGTVKISNTTFTVELATTTLAQARGLSFRKSLGENDGMLFVFKSPGVQNFWMKDMNFPIDIIWIGGGHVLGFAENAAPQPGAALWQLKVYSSPDGTDKVLEVNAGTVAKDDIHIGDAVRIGG